MLNDNLNDIARLRNDHANEFVLNNNTSIIWVLVFTSYYDINTVKQCKHNAGGEDSGEDVSVASFDGFGRFLQLRLGGDTWSTKSKKEKAMRGNNY